MDIDENEVLDISRSEMIEKFIIGEYGWANVQKALFDILISGNKTIEEYDVIGEVFLSAISNHSTIEKDRTVALINYRCNPFDYPYDNNIAWTITVELYNLDYANSEYNAFRDKRILSILRECNLVY